MLLRTFLRPTSVQCTPCQLRFTSNFMPRHKYAKVNRLDKLHRQEKKTLLQERIKSYERALVLEEKLKSVGNQESTTPLEFHIGRTKSQNFPVYESKKAGGNKRITTLQHVSGDLRVVQNQLQAVLDLPAWTVDGKGRKKQPVAINHLTRHIVIAGWRGAEVKKWAELLGF